MKIAVSQKDKKILITFEQGSVVDNFLVDKSDGFLLALDKFLKKNNIRHIGQIGRIGPIEVEFENTGILTERVIRAIIAGLLFSTLRVVPRRGK